MPFHSKRMTVTRVRGSATRSFCDAPLLSSSYSPVFHLDHTHLEAGGHEEPSEAERRDEARARLAEERDRAARVTATRPRRSVVERPMEHEGPGGSPPGGRLKVVEQAGRAGRRVLGGRRVGEAASRRGGASARRRGNRYSRQVVCVSDPLFFGDENTALVVFSLTSAEDDGGSRLSASRAGTGRVRLRPAASTIVSESSAGQATRTRA